VGLICVFFAFVIILCDNIKRISHLFILFTVIYIYIFSHYCFCFGSIYC
jgi:hypothetical protein